MLKLIHITNIGSIKKRNTVKVRIWYPEKICNSISNRNSNSDIQKLIRDLKRILFKFE